MSYYNKISHPKFGELWYEVTLRNFCIVGNSAKDNLALGPAFQIELVDYAVTASGSTLKEAEESLDRTVATFDKVLGRLPESVLPTKHELESLRNMRAEWIAEGYINEVMPPTR